LYLDRAIRRGVHLLCTFHTGGGRTGFVRLISRSGRLHWHLLCQRDPLSRDSCKRWRHCLPIRIRARVLAATSHSEKEEALRQRCTHVNVELEHLDLLASCNMITSRRAARSVYCQTPPLTRSSRPTVGHCGRKSTAGAPGANGEARVVRDSRMPHIVQTAGRYKPPALAMPMRRVTRRGENFDGIWNGTAPGRALRVLQTRPRSGWTSSTGS